VLGAFGLANRILDLVEKSVTVSARPLPASGIKIDLATLHLDGEKPQIAVRDEKIAFSVLFSPEVRPGCSERSLRAPFLFLQPSTWPTHQCHGKSSTCPPLQAITNLTGIAKAFAGPGFFAVQVWQ
jgi:hypothetical protein